MEAKSRRPAAQATRRKASSNSAKIVELPVTGSLDPDERLSDPGSYINRELSWLDFDARVLAEAQDPRVPLLERLRFLAITSNNLDEFYMIRVASLKRQVAERVQSTHADLMTPTEQLRAISKRTREIVAAEGRCLRDDLAPQLERQRVRMVLDGQPLSRSEQRACDDYFEAQLYPLLTPLAIDPAHPFPFVSNLSLSIAVMLGEPGEQAPRVARVKVPTSAPRLFQAGRRGPFVPIERIIAERLDRLFPGMEIMAHGLFRVTRDADFDVDEDEPNLLSAIEEELRERRFGAVVRVETAPGLSAEIVTILETELAVSRDEIQEVDGMLDLTGLLSLVDSVERPDLSYPQFTGTTPPRLLSVQDQDPDFFAVLRRGDVLVHHPYDSFAATTERFIEQAARDPKVVAIKQTLYRTSGDTPIIDALTRAAEDGKQVVVLVEIKARFDEQNNIRWARQLEQVGAHVAYGVPGLKTHAKLVLVVRQEESGIRYYAHVGTGNYNAVTARLYTDMGLLTANPEITTEVADLFNYLTGYSRKRDYQDLWVAPINAIQNFERLVEREVEHHRNGRPAGLLIKINGLTDERAIRSLYQASQSGLPIRLLVRGICSLRPGIEGLSSTIQVHSVIGRFLEHGRAFIAENGGQPEVHIGSSDLMGRNLYRRVECVIPLLDPQARDEVREVMEMTWADRRQSWRLQTDGRWLRVDPASSDLGIQEDLIRRARARPLRWEGLGRRASARGSKRG
ncbi:MAG: polyphosphate kinase 1 [Candidatus Dormiibacterota bacterium]|jgi:polyphosphate kinase